jgi:UDP-N-acetylglucosamine:LPS N-acetylglucosamine transferase
MNQPKYWKKNEVTFYNYLLKEELQNIINSSKIVICRSGYSTILDLSILKKKAFFIPTKHQSEQEYLAKYLEEKGVAPFCKESDFSFEKIKEVKNYSGFSSKEIDVHINLNGLFNCK